MEPSAGQSVGAVENCGAAGFQVKVAMLGADPKVRDCAELRKRGNYLIDAPTRLRAADSVGGARGIRMEDRQADRIATPPPRRQDAA